MNFKFDRRTALKAGAALAAASALPASLPARAQAKPNLRVAAVFSDKDIRADMVRMIAKDVGNDFNVETFFNGRSFTSPREQPRPGTRRPHTPR